MAPRVAATPGQNSGANRAAAALAIVRSADGCVSGAAAPKATSTPSTAANSMAMRAAITGRRRGLEHQIDRRADRGQRGAAADRAVGAQAAVRDHFDDARLVLLDETDQRAGDVGGELAAILRRERAGIGPLEAAGLGTQGFRGREAALAAAVGPGQPEVDLGSGAPGDAERPP